MLNSKKILITGASGFIGSFLVETALSKGYEVWAGIRKTSSKEYLKDKRINFIELNFNDRQIIREQLNLHFSTHNKFDYIIHNAGATKCLQKEDFYKINFHYTVNFIDSLTEANQIPEKFIFMSSLSVMGKGDETHYTPFRLTDTPKPNTAYGKSKLKAETYLKKQSQLPHIIFRPTGVYGPREKDYLMMIKSVISGLDISAGSKPQHLTFIYVSDLAEAIFEGIESDIINQTYFISDGNTYTDKEYSSLIKQILGKKFTLNLRIPLPLLKVISVFCESITKLTHKPSTLNKDKYLIMSQRNWQCDTEPLFKDLKFTPKYDLQKGLQESIDWYKNNNWL